MVRFSFPNTIVNLIKNRSYLLFIFLLIVYNINFRIIATNDSIGASFLPLSLIQELNFDLDEFSFLYKDNVPYYLTRSKGHIYHNYSVITPILAVPIYLLPTLCGIVDSYGKILFLAKISASVMASLSAIFFYLSLIRMQVNNWFAIFLTLSYALATSTWAISSQALWDHTSGELFLSAALFYLISVNRSSKYLIPAGAACALAFVSRMNNLFIVLSILVYVLICHRKEIWLFMIFPIIIGIAFFSLNISHFGTLIGGAGELLKTIPVRQGIQGGWSRSFVEGFTGILFSPSRGLLIFSPWLIFSFVGMVVVWQKRGNWLFKCLSVGAIFTILFFSNFSVWWGGLCYGPRYLTDILPVLALFIYFIRDMIRRHLVLGFLLSFLITISIFVQAIGAFNYSYNWYYNPTNVDYDHERLWDWRDSVIIRSVKNGVQEPIFLRNLRDKPKR